MELTKDSSQASYQIQRYQPGVVTINHENHACPIIVTPEKLITWPIPSGSSQNNFPAKQVEIPFHLLSAKDFAIFVELSPNIVIVGCGEKNTLLPMDIFLPLIEAKIGFEVMSSAAACRTYSLLSLEGRNVAVGLIY